MRTVEWPQETLDDLTRLWTGSDSDTRKAITKACHALEKQLAHDADNTGESRSDNRRIAFESPVILVFRVEADNKTVTILEVRLMRRRKK
jgi:hypothetical protein